MKKTLAILLLLCLCIGLCACGDQKNWDPIAEATATLNELYNCKTEEDLKKVLHETSEADIGHILTSVAALSHLGYNISVTEIKYLETVNGYDVFLFDVTFKKDRTYQQYIPLVGYRYDTLGMCSVHGNEEDLEPFGVSDNSNGICYLSVENGHYVLSWPVTYDGNFVISKEEMVYIDCECCNMGGNYEAGTIDCENCNQGWVLDTEHDAANCEDCQYYSESGTEVYQWLTCDECSGFGTVDTVFVDCAKCNGMGAVTLESLKIQ